MRGLAAYILRGPLQAISAATGFALLALLFMPLSWPLGYLSMAAIALVVLAKGLRQAGVVVSGAILLLSGMFGLILGQLTIGLAFASMNWLPAMLVATILVFSRSLSLAILCSAGIGAAVIGLIFVLLQDPAAWWFDYFTTQVLPLLRNAGVELPSAPEFDAQLKGLAQLMTGTLVGFMVLGVLLAVLLARSWQSAMYRPGAYREEFHTLRLGVAAAALALLLMLVAMLGEGKLAELAGNFLPVVMVVFLLQGLAVVHSLLARKESGKPWLIAVYAGLVVTMPYLLIVIATVGMLDNWMNLRRKLTTVS